LFAQTTILGRVGQTPELRFTENGTAACKFSVAVSRKYKTKTGEQKEETVWYKVQTWQATAENVSKYVSKGDMIFVTGALQTPRVYDSKGESRCDLELRADVVRFLGSKKKEAADPEIDIDEIPF